MSWSTIVGSVVMIGQGLIGLENPHMLDQLLNARSEAPVTVEAQVINDASLQFNWDHADNAEGINSRDRLRHPTDAVIVTEAIPLANHLKWSGTADAIAQFYDLSRAANPDVQFYLQETWHSLRSGSGELIEFDDGMATPWRDRLDQDLPRWQRLVDQVNSKTGGQILLLPAGQAMARLDDAIQAGTVPGLTRINDVFADDIHPNDIGFYFLALLQYAVLTGDTPIDLPYQLTNRKRADYRAPSPDMAHRLQQIAWEAAQSSETRVQPCRPTPRPCRVNRRCLSLISRLRPQHRQPSQFHISPSPSIWPRLLIGARRSRFWTILRPPAPGLVTSQGNGAALGIMIWPQLDILTLTAGPRRSRPSWGPLEQ